MVKRRFCLNQFFYPSSFFFSDIRRHTNGLADMGRCSHDACGRESNVCCADKPSSKEQVLDILTIKTTVRNLVDTFSVPLVTARFLAEYTIGGMQIDIPSPIRHGVFMLTLFNNILLAQHIIPLETTAFAFSGHCSHPFQCHSFGFGEIA